MRGKYNFKVDWCNACDQGWIEIRKYVNHHNQFIFKCSECFVEFKVYEDINKKTISREISFNSIEPTDDEVHGNGLWGYIIKEWEKKMIIRNDGVLWKVWSEEKKMFVKP
ncbi:hypothetical protein R70331_22885 [Paenibacillus sp. FSL R7-0331]|nr:hypothetical protein R70331_22885 [Paenibacillus sp. FSL R7-0331]